MELKAKKSLGQNFLNSEEAIKKIIRAAELKPGETVFEIGPGTGILTRALLETGANVVAVEKDERAVALLREKFAREILAGTLGLRGADILNVSRVELALADGQYALVANIPYYLTGMILESFLEYAPRPSRMVLLVQKEVAQRIAATDKKESVLSISVKAFGQPRIVGRVPRGAFVPVPGVDSAILSVSGVSDCKFREKGLNTGVFFQIVKAGFAHKRKLLRKNLEAVLDRRTIDENWRRLNLDDNLRAEDATLDDWFQLATSAKNPSQA